MHNKLGLFLLVYVGNMKMVGGKQNLKPMWKILQGDFGLGEPTPLIDEVFLECTQREAKVDYQAVKDKLSWSED